MEIICGGWRSDENDSGGRMGGGFKVRQIIEKFERKNWTSYEFEV